MEESPKPITIIDSLGEEIIRIITPVTTCMFLVVLLVTTLNSPSSSSSSSSMSSIATIAYSEKSSDSIWSKLTGALLNSLIFVAIITATTFLLVLLFYFRCIKFLKFYMGFSAFVVLGFMGSSGCLEARNPSQNPISARLIEQKVVVIAAATTPWQIDEKSIEGPRHRLENGVRERGLGGEVMEEMPCVSTRGEGFLYKYGKGEEVKIVCMCHGSFLSPAEFVREACWW